jgi:AsmA protein
MKRKLVIIVGIVIAVLIVSVLVLPMLIDANQFKPELESKLAGALGRQVQIGKISLAILSGGVTIDNVSIADDSVFSRSPFLTAKQLTVGVNLMPLIFSKKLEVRSFTVVEPEVSLWRNSAGVWNFSSLGAAKSKTAPQGGGSLGTSGLSVQKLVISNGKITVGTVGSRAKPLVYQDVNLEASDLSYTSQFPFSLTAKTPGNGTVKVDGKAGPLNQSDISLSPLDAKVEVRNLDLAATGFVNPSSGIAGIVDFNGNLASDGRQMSSRGAVKTDKLKLVAAGTPSRMPVNIDYNTEYDLRRQTGVLQQGDVHIGKALARLAGTYNTAGEQTTVQMKLNGQGMSVPDLEGVLPAVGVTLPSGASLQAGTLDTTLAISGPLDHLLITGPVNLANGKMKGFNLGSKLGALASFAGIGGGGGSDTEIQSLKMNLRMDPQGTHAENMNLVVPTIGIITGNGNVSPSGQLDCRMLAKLANMASSPAGQLATQFGGFGGGGGGRQNNGIPFKIQGTTSNPVFIPDIAGIAGSMIQNQVGAGSSPADTATGILGGLLNKKKPPQ